jgi:hypothetical protein
MAADPRYLKIQQLKGLLALYEEGESSARTRRPVSPHRPAFVPRPKPGLGRIRDPKRLKILEASLNVLRELNSSHPVKTGDIYELLPAEIVELIAGENPRGNLSALIHNSKQFISHGRAGWSLPSGDAESQEPESDTPHQSEEEEGVNPFE